MQLAIERLGARLIVAPKLISDGVDALKGNESVRLADARLLLGLSWGGVAAQMRLSTACVRAFLLITALKICAYDHQGIAEIIYEYLSSAKLLDLEPVSVRQLTGLVDVMSGHSNALLHSVQDTMDEIIQSMTSLGEESWPRLCFEAVSVKLIADIFLRCFEAIQQVEGGYVEISGEQGLLWIATVLLWLNPDEVGLVSQDRLLFGTAGGKVRIIVHKAPYDWNEALGGWKIKTWKAGKSITMAISRDDRADWGNLRRTRRKIVRRYVRYHLLQTNFVEHQIESIDLVGALAAGLIDAALLFGTVHVRYSGDLPKIVRVSLLYEQSFIKKGGCVMEEYGWDLEHIRANATEVLARLSNSVAAPIRPTIDLTGVVGRIVESILMDVFNNLGTKFDDRRHEEYKITSTALRLAGHALASAHAKFGTLIQFYYPDLASEWISQLFLKMRLEQFIEEIRKAAGVDVKGLPEPSLTASIHSSEGRVVIPRVMLDHSTRRDSLFKVVVIPGRIHYEGSCFDAVVAVDTGFVVGSGIQRKLPRTVPIFDQNTRQPVLLVPDERNTVTLEYFFAMEQRLLLMRTSLSFDQDGSAVNVSYQDCIRNLALAFHATPSKNALGMREISKELSRSRLDEVTLIDCLTSRRELEDSEVQQRFVTHVPNSQEMRFFASHSDFQPRDCALCILQGADIVEALHSIMTGDELTPSNHKPWRIITGNDR